MADMFDIANLITSVGVDAVKIKQEPGLPEKSSNEILTELFSTFDAHDDIETPVNDSAIDDADADDDENDDDDDDDNDNDNDNGKYSSKVKKKKKKSKKKHKHNKDKKHKRKNRKNSSASDSELEVNGIKKKKKHKKKLKRKRNSDTSNSTDSDEPKIKIKKNIISVEKNWHSNNELKTIFDLVQSVVIKKEPGSENDKLSRIERTRSDSPELPPISKKNHDELDEPVAPRLLGILLLFILLIVCIYTNWINLYLLQKKRIRH